jgi:hypothetical protein
MTPPKIVEVDNLTSSRTDTGVTPESVTVAVNKH